ncbi:MAG: HNH endonuclease [Desulfobacterales bacterium]|nr:HNH endonuclease [Desulfobacterales bacterium]
MRKERITVSQRHAVSKRAEGCCEYCLSQACFSMQSFSIEHILPVDKGGKTELENLALSCQGCNNHKYNKTEGYDSVIRQIVPLYHPRKQKWNEHFVWNEDCTLIIGITQIGRATVSELHLNREGLINLRRILYTAKKHPPKISM